MEVLDYPHRRSERISRGAAQTHLLDERLRLGVRPGRRRVLAIELSAQTDGPEHVRVNVRDARCVRAHAVIRERRVLVGADAREVTMHRHVLALVDGAEPRRAARHARVNGAVHEVRERDRHVALPRRCAGIEYGLPQGRAGHGLRARGEVDGEGARATRECHRVRRGRRAEGGHGVVGGDVVVVSLGQQR